MKKSDGAKMRKALPKAPRARARTSDPDTSHRAAKCVTPALRQIQRAVLGFAAERGEQGFSDLDLAKHFDCDGSTYRTRRAELKKLGLIEDSKKRISVRVRSSHAVWKITAAGIKVHRDAAND